MRKGLPLCNGYSVGNKGLANFILSGLAATWHLVPL